MKGASCRCRRQLQPYRTFTMASAIKTRLLVSQSDEKLLELAQHGCEVAFETLARRYRRPLLRHCRQLCLLEDQAQEVLKRTFSEAWRGLQGQTQPVEPASWLRGIAQRMAVEPALDATLSDGAPRPDEVLALRGALAAISPLPQQSQVIMHGRNGNKSHEPIEDAFDFADSAFRGLLGRARRGISALTPPPLLAWLAGRAAQGGAGGERIAELGGGGAAGLGLAVKGAVAALTASVAITGAVIATSSKHPHGSHAAHRVVAARRVAPGPAPGAGESGPVRVSVARHRGGQETKRSRAHLLRSRGGSAVAALPPAIRSTGASHVNSPLPAAAGAPASAPAAAPQASTGSAQTPAGGTETQAPGGSSPSSSSSSGSGAPSEPSQSGAGVQVSVETSSTSSESQSSGTGVGVSISLEPVISVGVHISLP